MIQAAPLVAAAACDFGWGSLGKLRLILDALPGVEVALQGEAAFLETARALLGDSSRFVHKPAEEANVGLVINDPAAAYAFAGRGLPIVYVDSLPYLWAKASEVPARDAVALYCAQSFPGRSLARTSPLAGRGDLVWVDPIVPPARRRTGGGGVVVNVGGLHSHLAGGAVEAYLSLIVLPLAERLAAAGRPVAAVCGNLPARFRERLAALLPGRPPVGAQLGADFDTLLRRADLLITSPGSTTLLQASAMRLPTLLLPPQNLSQILNAALFARPDARPIQWPAEILDLERVEALRPEGEDAALAYIYGAIARAAVVPALAGQAAEVVAAGLADAPAEGLLRHPPREGWRGAEQVAQRLRQAILAPLPRPVPISAA